MDGSNSSFAITLAVVAAAVVVLLAVLSGMGEYKCPPGTRMVWLRYEGRACVVEPVRVRKE